MPIFDRFRRDGKPFMRIDLMKEEPLPDTMTKYSFGKPYRFEYTPARKPSAGGSQPGQTVTPTRNLAKQEGAAVRPQPAKQGPARSTQKSPKPVYSPLVARLPPTSPRWPLDFAVRESDLDPAYRATVAQTGRLKNSIMRSITIFALSSGLIGYLLVTGFMYLWTGSEIPHSYDHPERTQDSGLQWPPFTFQDTATIMSMIASGDGKALVEDGESASQQMWRSFADFLTTRRGFFDGDDNISNNWFADVDNATSAIMAMWVAQPIPKPVTDEGSAKYQAMRNQIEARVRQVRKARGAWEKFRETREQVVADLIRSGTAPLVYINDERVDEKKAAEIEKKVNAMLWILGMPEIRKMGLGRLNITGSANVIGSEGPNGEEKDKDGYSTRKRALDTLRLVEEPVIEFLERAHNRLFEIWDVLAMHVQEAENIEEEFIHGLLQGSPKRNLWTPPLFVSLRALRRRVEKAHGAREVMRFGLEHIRGEFAKARLEEEEDQSADVKRLRTLLERWIGLLAGVQEGVLFMLRRREAQSWSPEHRNASTYEATWETWKSRNCGGTSCYDMPSMTGRIKRLFLQGRPMAELGQDEANWFAKHGHDGTSCIWQSRYEEICCEDGVLSHRLKYAKVQPSKD